MATYRAVVTVEFEAGDDAEFRAREDSLLECLVHRASAEFAASDFRVTERRPRTRPRCPSPDETWPGRRPTGAPE